MSIAAMISILHSVRPPQVPPTRDRWMPMLTYLRGFGEESGEGAWEACADGRMMLCWLEAAALQCVGGIDYCAILRTVVTAIGEGPPPLPRSRDLLAACVQYLDTSALTTAVQRALADAQAEYDSVREAEGYTYCTAYTLCALYMGRAVLDGDFGVLVQVAGAAEVTYGGRPIIDPHTLADRLRVAVPWTHVAEDLGLYEQRMHALLDGVHGVLLDHFAWRPGGVLADVGVWCDVGRGRGMCLNFFVVSGNDIGRKKGGRFMLRARVWRLSSTFGASFPTYQWGGSHTPAGYATVELPLWGLSVPEDPTDGSDA